MTVLYITFLLISSLADFNPAKAGKVNANVLIFGKFRAGQNLNEQSHL
jgi:hypothetical protein